LKRYLIDTNIAIYFLSGKYGMKEKLNTIAPRSIYISEITVAELKFGVENSDRIEENKQSLYKFLLDIEVLPIYHSIDLYAKEKARLRKQGISLDDFDLLIAATSITHNLIMVTNNTKHFKNVSQIILEDWTITTTI
jgi:tRNA(fMet)-specific endonuclease VapC